MKMPIRNLIKEYNRRKNEIRNRLKEFESLGRRGGKAIFKELIFCILTANANALSCDKAIRDLKDRGLLFRGREDRIIPHLKGRVRFHNKKARFLVSARRLFSSERGRSIDIRRKIGFKNPFKARDWLVENVKGLGYKEASHFLRNIGFGKDIAILDRHILKNLKSYGVIDKAPTSVGSRRIYLDIEERMRAFSRKISIPLGDLDLLFWSIETGFVFK